MLASVFSALYLLMLLTATSTAVSFNSSDLFNATNISTLQETGSERNMDWFRLQPKEIVYVIAGNRYFGGHGKQLFRAPILDIVRFTGEQFNETAARFGVVWANAYITMNIVAPLLAKASEAEHMLENFLHEVPEPFPTALSGLEGSIEYAVNNIFTPDRDIIKVMVLLTHWNMLHADVNEFLKQKCYRVVLFVLVFPWPYQKCNNPKVQRMVLHMNNRLNMTGLLKNQMAFCGRRIDILEKFQPYIFDGYESFRTQVTWCDIHYPITTTTAPPPPCQWSYTDFQSMVICHGNVIYAALCLVIFFCSAFTCGLVWICISFVSFINDYRKELEAKNKQYRETVEEICEEKPVKENFPMPENENQFLSSAMRSHSRISTSIWNFYRKPNKKSSKGILSRLSRKKRQKSVTKEVTITVIEEKASIPEIDVTTAPRKKGRVEVGKFSTEKPKLLRVHPPLRRQSSPEFQDNSDQKPQHLGLAPADNTNLRRKSISAFDASLKPSPEAVQKASIDSSEIQGGTRSPKNSMEKGKNSKKNVAPETEGKSDKKSNLKRKQKSSQDVQVSNKSPSLTPDGGNEKLLGVVKPNLARRKSAIDIEGSERAIFAPNLANSCGDIAYD